MKSGDAFIYLASTAAILSLLHFVDHAKRGEPARAGGLATSNAINALLQYGAQRDVWRYPDRRIGRYRTANGTTSSRRSHCSLSSPPAPLGVTDIVNSSTGSASDRTLSGTRPKSLDAS